MRVASDRAKRILLAAAVKKAATPGSPVAGATLSRIARVIAARKAEGDPGDPAQSE